ncbi:MAG TPA: response regulator transcription factor [Steroidobacteraceae bacterium]|nr:response regulator transcription factor [Steroidobacteraceae bacterium]
MKPVRILIADDHELIRRGLVAELSQTPGWLVAAQAANGLEAVALAAKISPDLIVLDLSMPELNGLAAARRILAADAAARILILTAHESEELVREVLAAGAQGYVLKSDAGRVLVTALQSLLDGRPFFTSKVARTVLDGYLRSPTSEPSTASTLSAREQEIVQLLAEGKSNKEVARALGISVKTAETHRSNIMRKTGFGSLAELVRFAVRNKIIEP